MLRTVVSHAPVVLFAVDAEGIFTLSDGAGLAPLGLAPGQVVGQSAFELYAGVPEIVAHLRRALAGEEHSGEVQVGALHYVARYTPLRDAEGRVSGVVGVATDVTESRRALAALRASEERYRNLYEKTPVMLHSIDPSGRLVSVSDAWCEVLGYTRAEVLGRRSTEFLSEASRGRAEEALQRLFATGGVREAPLQFVRKDGGTVDVLLSATVERDPTGGPLRYLGVLIDVTEQRRMQSRLLQSDRLASLGTLAAGVAHELNNPLTYLLGNLAHLRRLFAHGLPPNLDEVRDLLRTAAEGAERIRGIVDDLRVFTRPEGTRRERV
ncbi:MAG: PAS domain-containing sensor histidine kinase, partial [Planctomycetota bacterium]